MKENGYCYISAISLFRPHFIFSLDQSYLLILQEETRKILTLIYKVKAFVSAKNNLKILFQCIYSDIAIKLSFRHLITFKKKKKKAYACRYDSCVVAITLCLRKSNHRISQVWKDPQGSSSTQLLTYLLSNSIQVWEHQLIWNTAE